MEKNEERETILEALRHSEATGSKIVPASLTRETRDFQTGERTINSPDPVKEVEKQIKFTIKMIMTTIEEYTNYKRLSVLKKKFVRRQILDQVNAGLSQYKLSLALLDRDNGRPKDNFRAQDQNTPE